MNTDRRKILDMLAKGTITADEAEQLLLALDSQPGRPESGSQTRGVRHAAKFLRIQVTPNPNHIGHKEPVNIKVPIMLIKAGLKFPGLLSDRNRERIHGALGERGLDVDLNKLDGKSIEELIGVLSDTGIEVNTETEHVRIYCE